MISVTIKLTKMQIIDKQKELDQIIYELNSNKVIGIDTEFVRTNTYWPELCIIQISTKSNYYIIDVQSNLDFSNIWGLLTNKNIVKVIHSSRQDIEAIFYKSNKVPFPIFDTQYAAMFAGFRESISYSQIVEEIFQIKLDKELQQSDWSKRPLSNEMLRYAKDDVRYLILIYKYLNQKIEDESKKEWFHEEMDSLHKISIELSKKIINSMDYSNQKTQENIDPMSSLKELRDSVAMHYNIPRKSVLSDNKLTEILRSSTESISELKDLLNDNNLFTDSPRLLSMLYACLSKKNNGNKRIKYKSMLSKNQKIQLKLLNEILEDLSKKYNICPHVIATQGEIKEFITRGKDQPKFMKGWRRDIFGESANSIINNY